MSDLGGGSTSRASNGGVRTGGPVPVSGGTPTGIRTPRDVMRDRNAREARRQEAQREEEQRRLAEERRRSAERRAAAAVPGGAPRFSQASSQYSPDVSAQQGQFDGSGDRRQSRVAGEVAGSNVLGDPTGRASQEPTPRARGPSMSQSDQPRPVPTSAGATRRTPTSQSQPRHAPSASGSGAPPGGIPQAAATIAPGGDGAQRTQSSFPHAFERWETLSSHWEGLTSYWLHKLEQNTEEIKETVPNASTLNRQITDLSAAGANLFHAVVELQRLRASSERKFQRWFFETRAETERQKEVQGGLERQLKIERQAREETSRSQTDNSLVVENAKREVNEMRRELMISKEEARRAWEELGRRNQESLDTAQSLKEGRVTLVSGVQVVPYFGGPASRSGTASQGQRPVTRDGQGYGGSGFGGVQSPRDEQQYYREGPSPTNTDPFTDSGRQQPPLHHEGGAQSLATGTYQPYPMGTPASQGAAAPAASAHAPSGFPQDTSQSGQQATPQQQQQQRGGQQQPSLTSAEAQRFYQHAGPTTSLHSGSSSQGGGPAVGTAAHPHPVPREDVRSEGRSEASYVDTLSEGDTEYAIDAGGNIRHDEHGQPIVFRRRGPARSSESEDDFDTEEAVRRERELAARYGHGQGGEILPEAPTVPSTAAGAMETFGPTAAAAGGEDRPDYEGEGYDNYQQYVPRHHHPTRLSDVLEEDEERSSRRTGPD